MPDREVHVQLGSSLHLQCRIFHCEHPILTWSHSGYKLLAHEVSEEYVLKKDLTTVEHSDSLSESDSESNTTSYEARNTSYTDEYSTNSPAQEEEDEEAVAVLTLERNDVKAIHSGIYTCKSTCTPPVNVTVHVLIGTADAINRQK